MYTIKGPCFAKVVALVGAQAVIFRVLFRLSRSGIEGVQVAFLEGVQVLFRLARAGIEGTGDLILTAF